MSQRQEYRHRLSGSMGWPISWTHWLKFLAVSF